MKKKKRTEWTNKDTACSRAQFFTNYTLPSSASLTANLNVTALYVSAKKSRNQRLNFNKKYFGVSKVKHDAVHLRQIVQPCVVDSAPLKLLTAA